VVGLVPTHLVLGTDLRFIDLLNSEGDRYSLDDDGQDYGAHAWWHDVGASSVGWSLLAEGGDELGNVEPSADSARGAAVHAHLARLMAHTPMERVAHALAADPAQLPVETKRFSSRPIPGADDVVIPEAKLRGYALNLDHKDGKHKARLFRDVLNICADDWRYLAQQLRRGVRTAPTLRQVRSDAFAVRFDVVTAVKGRNGVVKPVLSGWIVRPGAPPSLATTFLAKRDTDADSVAGDVPILPLTSQHDWALLWQVATAAADDAAQLTVPQPAYHSGRWCLDGVEGTAEVRVRDARRGFGRWLRTSGHGGAGPQSGTWVCAPSHRRDVARAWAQTFAEIVRWHGIDAEAHDTGT
jgi:hypothetical protein